MWTTILRQSFDLILLRSFDRLDFLAQALIRAGGWLSILLRPKQANHPLGIRGSEGGRGAAHFLDSIASRCTL
jgi:hypothetical protein